jgi:hypothetical protein
VRADPNTTKKKINKIKAAIEGLFEEVIFEYFILFFLFGKKLFIDVSSF